MRNKLYILSALIILSGFIIGGWRALRVHSDVSIFNAGDTDITFVTTRTKSFWMLTQLIKYNCRHTKLIVKPIYMESRDAMADITNEKINANVWNPDSQFWAYRANELWQKTHKQPLINTNDPLSYRITSLSPLVFLTNKQKADELRPILSGSNPWSNIYKENAGHDTRLTYAIADPETSSSGILSIALITDEYARLHNITDKNTLLTNRDFINYLITLKKQSIIYRNIMSENNSIEADIAANKYDFIVLRENIAITAANQNPDLCIIYPTPTVTAQEAVCIADASGINEKRRLISHQFVELLSSNSAKQDAEINYLRPADSEVGPQFKKVINKMRSQGLQEDYVQISPPSYLLLNNIVYLWDRPDTHIKARKDL